jgi:hypothetical protein
MLRPRMATAYLPSRQMCLTSVPSGMSMSSGLNTEAAAQGRSVEISTVT